MASTKAVMAPATARPLDVRAFLKEVGAGRTVVKYQRKGTVFSQGDAADAVFHVQTGKVKLAVLSPQGKEAVVALLATGDFFGEGCLTGRVLRAETATALTACSLLRIEKGTMVRALHERHAFSEHFLAYLLSRNLQYEDALVDHLFNSSEKRLARILLLLSHFGKEGKPEPIAPKISQETLAQMVGTTRSRVNFFMNKFKKLGFIEYNDRIEVRSSLLSMVLHE
jgi:CRP/FNR family transcriptional regulator, cyclic AMP receptor protein